MLRETRVAITDTTLRDGHQSLWATRMKAAEMMPIVERLDQVGYWSLEVWGGATFDVALRFLNEDPWERLIEIRKRAKKTRLQMLLRGQNIVGYHNYPDDVLEAFVERAGARGIDVFRVFDALNDVRNLEKAIEYVKQNKKHAQGTLCYTISPIHTVEYYVERAREQKDLGIDSICIKDMAGILSPEIGYELVKALIDKIKLPVQLHCHASSGMAVATYLRAVDAGVSVLDTAHAPLAFATSQPAVETIVAMLRGTGADPELDLDAIESVSEHFDKVKTERCIQYDRIVDEMVIVHQIPGGMASNLVSQLKEQKALHRLKEVLEEVPRVRKDLGYPPLVTPTSQMVGVQAVFNVISGGRYKVVPKEVREYAKGLYGRSPAPIKEEVRKKILGNEAPITVRPADLLEPMMDKVHGELPKELATREEDYISYALFPEVALKFFSWRKNPTPDPDPAAKAQSAVASSRNPAKVTAKSDEPADVNLVRELLELASSHDVSELELDQGGSKVRIKRGMTSAVQSAAVQSAPAPKPAAETPPSPAETQVPKTEPQSSKVEPAKGLDEVKSPMVGTFYLRARPDAPPFVEKGSVVEPGETLCIIEAMKLMNEIEAEKKYRVMEILIGEGEPVEYGQVLFRVEPV